MKSKLCDLLVMSTDRFLPEAQVTIGQLKRLGLASRFDCHLSLGDLDPNIEDFRILHRTAPGTWSSELRSCLQQLEKPYVLLWLDDFVPLEMDPPDDIVRMIDELVSRDGNYLRVVPPKGNGPRAFGDAYEILPGEHYRTSTVFCAWKRATLLALLNDQETAWQFEYLGASRSEVYGGFFACSRFVIRYVNLIVKGLVDPRAERRLQVRGVDTSIVRKPRMNRRQLFGLQYSEFRSRSLLMLPWWLRRRIRVAFQTNVKTRG